MKNGTKMVKSIALTTIILSFVLSCQSIYAQEQTPPYTQGEAPLYEQELGIYTPELYSPPKTTLSDVVLPSLPATLEFAGERVPLENYDTRESLQRELLITSYMHSRTFLTLLSSKRYKATIEPIMERMGVPLDFIYLCMAESGLNPDIISSAGAGGLWQIMPKTGRDYGLQTGKFVDERYNIEKATEVACRHLLDSYAIFGSWTMAAAAYNLGNAGVSKRADIQGVKNYYNLFLPQETLRYIFRVLSYKVLCENPRRYGFDIRESDYYKPLTDYHEIVVKNAAIIDWSKVATENGTTYKMLRELNHWIRDYTYDNKAGKAFTVKIPNPDFRK